METRSDLKSLVLGSAISQSSINKYFPQRLIAKSSLHCQALYLFVNLLVIGAGSRTEGYPSAAPLNGTLVSNASYAQTFLSMHLLSGARNFRSCFSRSIALPLVSMGSNYNLAKSIFSFAVLHAGKWGVTLFRRGAIRLEQLEFHNAGFMRVLGFLHTGG